MTDPLAAMYLAEVATAQALILPALEANAPPPDWAALERAARQVHGSARIVGRSRVYELAQALEAALGALHRNQRTLTPELRDALGRAVATLGADDEVDTQELVAALRIESPPAPVPVPPPPPRVAPKSESNALIELFREEVRTLTATLSEGLVALEGSDHSPRRIEPLMRAAHSIKGAARIVDCPAGVDLAHALEERLVAAQSGAVPLDESAIDTMLKSVDLLAGLAGADFAAWSAAHGPAVEALSQSLAGAAPPRPLAVAPRPVANPVPPPPVTEPTEADRVVRISAQSLTRLLSLAGESLVEARRLQPFAQSLVRLKKQQDYLAAMLDNLPGGAPAQEKLTECRKALADRIDEFERHARLSDDLNGRLYREVIASRMRPFADGTHGVSRMVRDVARQLGKKVRLDIRGESTDVDRDILDKLEAPLGHLLRNALDHGVESPEERRRAGKPETATLTLEARHHAGELNVRVADDGRGVDLARLRQKILDRRFTTADAVERMSEAELLDFLFLPGFTTAERVTDLSGRGVGLDAVQAMAQAVGGTVRVRSRAGQGTAFELQLPITLSVLRAVLVTVAGEPFALPLGRADRLVRTPVDQVRTLEGRPHVEVDGRPIGLVSASQVFELPAPAPEPGGELAFVLLSDRYHQYALGVDGFLGEQDLVVRPLDPRLGRVPNIAAAAVLDDGSPVLILDVDDVIRSTATLALEGHLRHQRPGLAAKAAAARKRVLVVDDSAIVREAERQMLLGRGYEVDVAVDGADGLNAVLQGEYDLVVSDVDMPRMTGLEFVRALRAEARSRHLPVVIVSYKDRPEDRDRGRAAGANYYLTKGSFHDGQFLAAVEELIGPPS